MSTRRSTPVRLSDRRGSIGVAILMAVSLSLLGAQTVMGTGAAAQSPAVSASR
ncbi:MAG TPA: hypothetical protein VIT45_10845 [Allosphingosinicella sp.]